MPLGWCLAGFGHSPCILAGYRVVDQRSVRASGEVFGERCRGCRGARGGSDRLALVVATVATAYAAIALGFALIVVSYQEGSGEPDDVGDAAPGNGGEARGR